MKLSRRRFLVAGGAASACMVFSRTCSLGNVPGANDAIRVGVVGMGRGQEHIRAIQELDGFRLAALCDVDPARLGRTVEHLQRQGTKVDPVADIRRLLDRKDIDAITVATPNHWHALMGIWACQAGKDCYIEKPVSHDVWEGRQLVQAARKHGRMVQTGTQARSNPDLIAALQWVQQGNLGPIQYARGMCYKGRVSIGKVGPEGGAIPPGLDYDLWSGPAPLQQPLRRRQLHYDWHWVFDYGNGDLGNQGIHEVDIARWFLGHSGLPRGALSLGGRFGYEDDGQTPNTQVVRFDYDGPPILFDVRGLPRSKEYQSDPSKWLNHMPVEAGFKGGRTIGVIVVCEGGRLLVEDGGEQVVALDPAGMVIRRFETDDQRFGRGWSKGTILCFRNWAEAIRSRKAGALEAEILEGHVSSALCHVAMISYRLGQSLSWESARRELPDEPLWVERAQDFQEHLRQNGVDLSKTPVRLGSPLRMEPAGERFLDNDRANAMLACPYRDGFTVPAEV